MKKMRVALTIIILLLTQTLLAAEKQVVCEIKSNNQIEFKGKCLFLPENNGSFSLSALDKNKPLFDEILVISVTMLETNVAEVRGLTSQGINSRWGEAKHSMKDKACWMGDDFSICAR